MTVPGSLKQAAIDFVVSNVLLGGIMWVAWSLPNLRPDWFPDRMASTVIVIASSSAIAFLLHLARVNWFGRAAAAVIAAIRSIGTFGVVAIISYLLGIFLCERFGISPPLEVWQSMAPETLVFFSIYTGIALLLVALLSFLIKAFQRIANSDVEVNGPIAFALLMRPLWPFVLVTVFVAGLVIAEARGLAPPLTLKALTSVEFLRFLSIYLLAFLAFPLGLVFTGWVAWWLSGHILSFLRWIAEWEVWRRIWGVRYSKEELDDILKQKRDAKQNTREEDAKARRVQRQAENKEFGWVTAGILRSAPLVTAVAQALSFVTSYLGIKIYLSLRQENIEWLDLPLRLPSWIDADRFGLDVHFMSNDVIASVASAVMAVIIWMLSALAVGRVRFGQSVPFRVYVFTVVLGLSSTYTAFIMWNGEIAVRDELTAALRETESYLSEISGIDERVLINTARDVDGLRAELLEQRNDLKARALRGQLLELQKLVDRMDMKFSKILRLSDIIGPSLLNYQNRLDCEVKLGCLTNIKGRGAVALELAQHIEIFKTSSVSWERLRLARMNSVEIARGAAKEAVRLSVSRDTPGVQREITRLREAIISIMAEDPAVILGKLKARLSVPLSNKAPSASQRQALLRLQRDVESDLEIIAGLLDLWVARDFTLPVEIRVDEIALPISADIALLNQVSDTLALLREERRFKMEDFSGEIEALFARIRSDAADDILVSSATDIIDTINGLRDEIEEQLSNLDPRPISTRLKLLQSGDGKLNKRFGDLSIDYPKIDEFVPTTLAYLILNRWYLSVVPLLIQLMLDFGYTLTIIAVVSGLRRKEREG